MGEYAWLAHCVGSVYGGLLLRSRFLSLLLLQLLMLLILIHTDASADADDVDNADGAGRR